MKFIRKLVSILMKRELDNLHNQIARQFDMLSKYERDFKNNSENRFNFFVSENIGEWEKIRELIRTGAFRSLVFFLNSDLEEKVLEIRDPSEVHRFWYIQGAKSVLADLLNFNEAIQKKIAYLVNLKTPTKPKDEEPAQLPTYN